MNLRRPNVFQPIETTPPFKTKWCLIILDKFYNRYHLEGRQNRFTAIIHSGVKMS